MGSEETARGQGLSEVIPGGERILVVCPMTGTGTTEDPVRPSVVRALEGERLSYRWMASDDGKSAIVEVGARNRSELKRMLDDKDLEGKVFMPWKHKKDDVEKALKKWRKDFDIESFLGLQQAVRP
jgi:hypothetical protein